MARTRAALGTGALLADYLSASLLARVVSAEVVNRVLNANGRNSQLVRRSLPDSRRVLTYRQEVFYP